MAADATESDLPATFGAPARRALIHAGITQLSQLTDVSERELLKMHGVGPRAVRLLRGILADRGLRLAGADTLAGVPSSHPHENA